MARDLKKKQMRSLGSMEALHKPAATGPKSYKITSWLQKVPSCVLPPTDLLPLKFLFKGFTSYLNSQLSSLSMWEACKGMIMSLPSKGRHEPDGNNARLKNYVSDLEKWLSILLFSFNVDILF